MIVLKYWVCHKLNSLSCEIYTCLEGWCPCVTSSLIAILRLGFSGSEFVAPLPASSRCCFAVVMRALEPVCSFHLMPLRAEAWVSAPAFCDGEFREGSVTPGKSGRVCTWRRGDSSGGQAVWRGSLRRAPDGLSFLFLQVCVHSSGRVPARPPGDTVFHCSDLCVCELLAWWE